MTFTRFVAPEVPEGRQARRTTPSGRSRCSRPARGSDQLVDQLAGGPGPTLDATTFSKWGPRLAGPVGAGPVLAGVSTDCCVLSTALAAADAGTPVRVVGDACAGFDDDSHAAALRILQPLQSPLIEVVTLLTPLTAAARITRSAPPSPTAPKPAARHPRPRRPTPARATPAPATPARAAQPQPAPPQPPQPQSRHPPPQLAPRHPSPRNPCSRNPSPDPSPRRATPAPATPPPPPPAAPPQPEPVISRVRVDERGKSGAHATGTRDMCGTRQGGRSTGDSGRVPGHDGRGNGGRPRSPERWPSAATPGGCGATGGSGWVRVPDGRGNGVMPESEKRARPGAALAGAGTERGGGKSRARGRERQSGGRALRAGDWRRAGHAHAVVVPAPRSWRAIWR